MVLSIFNLAQSDQRVIFRLERRGGGREAGIWVMCIMHDMLYVDLS